MPCAKKGAGRSTTTVKFVPLVSGDALTVRIYRVIPCSACAAHFVRRGGDCTTRGIPAMAATMTTALCAAVPTRVDRAHGSRTRGRAPRRATPRLGPRGGRAPRALRPRRGTTASAFGDPDRGSPRWSAPPRGPYRDVRGGGANELHRVPRAVLRELDGRENRTGAVPHPVLHAKKAAEEASVFERSGGFVYIRNFFSP